MRSSPRLAIDLVNICSSSNSFSILSRLDAAGGRIDGKIYFYLFAGAGTIGMGAGAVVGALTGAGAVAGAGAGAATGDEAETATSSL